MESVISVEHVSKKFKLYYDRPLTIKERIVKGSKGAYKEFFALKDVSFEIKKGSTVGLIGQNGSGKSTMLKIINRTMFPDEGKVTIKGKVASLIELGAGFHPELSGRENIYTNATIFGFTKEEIDERIPDIIKFSELEEFIDNPIRTYSSGMYARLAFAVAIHVDADILLVDEILGVGDMNFQNKCAQKIYEMKEKGTTILVVTHDMGTIDKLCDYGIWLDHGQKLDEGVPRYIQNRYMEFMSEQKENRKNKEAEDIEKIDFNSIEGRIDIQDIVEFGDHYGNGDVIFTGVTRLDADGNERSTFKTGEDVHIKVNYKKQTLAPLKASLGIEIQKRNSGYIYGTNTVRDGIDVVELKDEGVIEIALPSVEFLDGEYTIGLALTNVEETETYDYYHEITSINVYSDRNDIGGMRVAHEYLVDGTIIK